MPDEIDTSNMSAEEIAELQKQNCIFCKIAEKQIPAKIIHEDDDIICVLDINPASEGHILVLPKKHYMILPHIPDEVLGHLFKDVQLMSHTLLKTLQGKGTTIFIANGAAAGQRAPHVLVHVFPRREGDGLVELPRYEMNDEQLLKLRSSLKPYLNQLFGAQKTENEGFHKVKTITTTQPKEKVETLHAADINAARNVSGEEKEVSEKTMAEKEPANKKIIKTKTKDSVQDKEQKKSAQKLNLDDISRLFGA